ncbi:MAG: radical SAM family heme chaperone HemW [Anderseniella sp.]|nr:radical SAM family heme chaperone HemW [Anderseniella sp.]
MTAKPPEFGVYVHWPFCKAKCPYCDFNSHVRHGGVDAASFANGLCRELDWFAAHAPGRTVTSVFFGGGTPSLMPPEAVANVIDHVANKWTVASDVEITLEANPTSIEADNFRGYRAAGVNRVSVGVQALNDDDLKSLGRQHSVEEALAAFALARRIFPRTSFDLIYARPRQTPQQWHDELTRALAEQDGHMSLYQLTIEPETAFFDLHEAGSLKIPDEDTGAELYELTQELTAAAGLPAYEVSNHAAPGKECRHNMLYWRYGEYAGVGPGAHGRLVDANGVRRATVTERHPETWLSMVRSQGNGLTEQAPVSGEDAAAEYVLMSLRTQEGTSLARLATLAGRQPDQETLSDLCAGGFLSIEPDGEDQRLIATARGRQLLNAVIEQVVLKALR